MARVFRFEADSVAALRYIPMVVRFKLDTCGIKLKLAQWQQFSSEDRQALVDRPCAPGSAGRDLESYGALVCRLVLERAGTPATALPVDADPAWMNAAAVPAALQASARQLGATISPDRWAALTPLERYALIKLGRPGDESRNFLPALREFHLL